VPPSPGESIEDFAAEQNNKGGKRPTFLFVAEDHRFALYGTHGRGALDDGGFAGAWMLVFEDDRYLGRLETAIALDDSACLAQPGGTSLLAERLRALTAGDDDPLAQQMPDGSGTLVEVRCPPGPDGAPEIRKAPEAPADESFPVRAGKAIGEGILGLGVMAGSVLIAAGFVVVAPVVIPVTAGYEGVKSLMDEPSLKAQEKLELRMDSAEVAHLMGKPSAVFHLEPAGTEVRYYARTKAPGLWIGLDDGRVDWVRFAYPDKWLIATTRRLEKEQPVP
jgi:hypothetical protein